MLHYKFDIDKGAGQVVLTFTSLNEVNERRVNIGEFVERVADNSFGEVLVDILGWLPEQNEPFWDDFFDFYKAVSKPKSSDSELDAAKAETLQRKSDAGPVKRLLIGLVRPSIVPQALIKHRVSPFADSERAWDYFSYTQPALNDLKARENVKREEQRMYQQQQITRLKQEGVAQNEFLAMMIVLGVTPSMLKMRYYVNLGLACFFFVVALFQVAGAYLRLTGQSKEIIPFMDKIFWLFGYTSWVMMAIVFITAVTMMFIRLWFCTLLNKRKLETEFTFGQFIKSFKWFPGFFKPLKLKRVVQNGEQ